MDESSKKSGNFSTRIHTDLLKLLAATEGIELAKHAVPFWMDIMKFQQTFEAKALLSHVHSMFIGIEDSLLREYSANGVSWISHTEHEIKKATVFADQLQDRTKMATSKYFELLKRFLLVIKKCNIPLDNPEWEDIINKVQKWTFEQASKLSTEQFPGSKVSDVRSVVSYYFEELVSVVGSPIEYDPIYSTPPGVKPSEVMEIRISTWQKSESVGLCECDSQRVALVVHTKPSQIQPDVSMSQLQDLWRVAEELSSNQSAAMIMPMLSQALLSSKLPDKSSACVYQQSIKAEKLLKSIDSLIDNLSLTRDSDEIVAISMSFIKELINSDLLKIAVPFLVTLLHTAVTLYSTYRKEAYKLLVDALRKLESNKQMKPFEKWILNTTCAYISSHEDLSGLPNLQTTMIKVLSYLMKRKPKELVINAAHKICNKESSLVFQQILTLYQSHEDLVPADTVSHSVITFLKGLDMIEHSEKENALNLILSAEQGEKENAIDLIVSAVWKNLDLCDAAAEVIASLLPYDYFPKVNNTCTLVVSPEGADKELYLYERDIQSKVISLTISPKEAALQYLDLMVNCELIHHSHQKVLCLLKAAEYFAIELQSTTQPQLQFALRNAVSLLAYDASQLALRLQPGMRVFALATSYRLTCIAAKLSDPSKHSCTSGRIACNMLRNLSHNSQFTFLLSQPMTLNNLWVAASSYINKVSDLAQQAYLQHLLNSQLTKHSLTVRRSLLHYQYLETLLHKGEFNGLPFKKAREAAMTELLKETRWTSEDVSNAMKTPLFQRDSKGFIEPNLSLSGHLEIAELKGVVFDHNENSPSIQVIVKPAKDGNGVLSYKDIIEILQLSSDEAETISFSLDPPSGTEMYHPFMKMRCHPLKLQNTEFMHSLFHADYLLKFLSTGIEVSAEPPFEFQPVEESLIKHLPDNLKFICRPPYMRGISHMTSHRFWIEFEEIFYDEHVSKSKVSYYIGDVKLSVKSRPLVTALNGKSFDAKHSDDGPHAQFADELTKHYEQISKYFPIFKRVRELSKLQFVVQRLCKHLESLKQTSPVQFESFSKELHRVQSLHLLKQCPESCTWVPATFGNPVYGGMLFKPKSTLGGYFAQGGADVPTGTCGSPAFPDVFDSLLRDVNPALHEYGGIRIGIQDQHRTDILESVFGNDTVCIHLGMVSVDNPTDHNDPETMSDPHYCHDKSLQLPIVSSRSDQDPESMSKTESTSDNIANELSPPFKETKPKGNMESDVKSDHKKNDVNQLQGANRLPVSPNVTSRGGGVETAAKVMEDRSAQNSTSQNVSGSPPQSAHLSPRRLDEYQIDSVMAKAARHRIVLLAGPEHQRKDTLSTTVSQSLVNQAIHGEMLVDSALQDSLKTRYDFNETNFHPNALARQQIKTAIVLRKIVELHIKQGTEEHIMSSQ